MAIFSICGTLLFLGLGYILIREWYLVYTAKSQNKLVKRLITRSMWALSVIFLLIILVLSCVTYEPKLDTYDNRLDHFSKYELYVQEGFLVLDSLRNDSVNLSLHLHLAQNYGDYAKYLERIYSLDLKHIRENRLSVGMEDFYRDMMQSPNDSTRMLGRSLLATHYFNRREWQRAENVASYVESSSYLSAFVKGAAYSRSTDYDTFQSADSLLIAASLDSTLAQLCIPVMATYYYRSEQKEKLAALVKEHDFREYSPYYSKRIVYMRSLDPVRYFGTIASFKATSAHWIGVVLAFIALIFWLGVLHLFDKTKRSRIVPTILVFIVSTLCLFLVYPMSDFLWDVIHFYPSEQNFTGFMYITISVGMVEELVKILPILFLLRWTTLLRRPIDYLFYASVSALGFAFIENIGYLDQASLNNFLGRSLLAFPGHMCLTCTVAYGLMLSRFRRIGKKWATLLVFYLIAAAMHGFYDFWLMQDSLREYRWISYVFVLVLIQFWVIYWNNAKSMERQVRGNYDVVNTKIRAITLLGIAVFFALTLITQVFTLGASQGMEDFSRSAVRFGFYWLFITLAISRFRPERGYLKPVGLTWHFMVPLTKKLRSAAGTRLKIRSSRKMRFIEGFESVRSHLPNAGVLSERIVVENSLDSFILTLDKPFSIDGYRKESVLVMPKSLQDRIDQDGTIISHIMLIPEQLDLERPWLVVSDFGFAGWVISSPERSD